MVALKIRNVFHYSKKICQSGKTSTNSNLLTTTRMTITIEFETIIMTLTFIAPWCV